MHTAQALFPVIDAHAPAGASMKQLIHFGQLIGIPKFQQYDYGIKDNFFIYGRSTPPAYDLKKCTVPVAIIYSEKDTLAFPRDILHLSHDLPNVIEMKRVEDPTFNHIDFVWAKDAKELVYNHIIDLLKMADERQRKS